MVFHPYFCVEYLFKAQTRDPTRKLPKFEDTDTLFVDALDGNILNPFPEKGLGIMKALQNISSSTARGANERTTKLLQELGSIEACHKYTVEKSANYETNRVKPVITPRQAIESCYAFIIEKNTCTVSHHRFRILFFTASYSQSYSKDF